MDSINRNQPEDNRQDVRGRDAIERIKKLVDKGANCFFCTMVSVGESSGSRPMNVRQIDDDGTFWFLSARDSHKNQELTIDPHVQLFFQGSSHSDFLVLNGRASISTEQAKIEELWDPIIKTWFTEGKEDPRITVIRVAPEDGYYWDTKHAQAIAGVKMMIGAVLGKTLDDSIEGKVDV